MGTPPQIRPVDAVSHVAWLPLQEGYQRFRKTEITVAISDATWQCFLDVDELISIVLA